MTWTKQYMHIPFKDVGRTKEGADCYGLPGIILWEQCGIRIDDRLDYKDTTPDETLQQYVADGIDGVWQAVASGKEKEFDVLLLRIMGLPIHIGMVTDVKNHMIHTVEGTGVTVENYRQGKWKAPGKIIGYYRHIELCKS